MTSEDGKGARLGSRAPMMESEPNQDHAILRASM